MKNIFFLFMVAILTVAASCNKENPEPENQCPQAPDCEGIEPKQCKWEIFTCKINGEDWCANCEDEPLFGCSPVDCQFYPDTKFFSIVASNENPKSAINFSSKPIQLGDRNLLKYRMVYGCSGCNLGDSCGEIKLDTTQLHRLNIIQIDTINKLIEAEFNFSAYDSICNNLISITDGYLKVSYRP